MPPRDTYQAVNPADFTPVAATTTIANTITTDADGAAANTYDQIVARAAALDDVITYTGTDLNTVTGAATVVDDTWTPWTTHLEPVRAVGGPITFTWRDEKEERIQALEKSIEVINEKFDAILKKLDQVLGEKLVISDLDLARLLGLGEV